ncbi:hypothetical protein ALP66_101374 [Pseudomonas amygdali pv. photiniae]|uniref:Uncharacterized protein n=2 Tax=Pseudomonas amygdali TaxID=47877 RepID=A0A3M6I7F5_PSEAJ|nr:hypothetical protein ALP66_101374 [Pseudomonas amygdali pv. photiniae]RMW13020.1 hypothetical protein ALP03_101195 [Pseudomonas amygdali pv. tabaci]
MLRSTQTYMPQAKPSCGLLSSFSYRRFSSWTMKLQKIRRAEIRSAISGIRMQSSGGGRANTFGRDYFRLNPINLQSPAAFAVRASD